MSAPPGYDYVCVQCNAPFIYANRSTPSDREVPLLFCCRRCWAAAGPSRATLDYPVQFDRCLAVLRLPRDLMEAEAERLCALIRSIVTPTASGLDADARSDDENEPGVKGRTT